jgi:hypothetical protein
MNGLQAERTALAWSRTVLVAAATGGSIARLADSGFERALVISLATIGVALAVATSIWRRRVIISEHVTASSGTVAGLLGGLVALLVAGLLVIL